MFSVIIPTLQLSPLLFPLVDSYCQSPHVDEVLVINNASPAPLEFTDPKVRVLDPGQNIYVNPAWNLGAESASAEYLIISNDDLLISPLLIPGMAERMNPRFGIVGPAWSCFEEPDSKLRLRRTYDRTYAFGTLMFLARRNYHHIPDELVIWCGDDYLFSQQSGRNYLFSGAHIESPMSVTSSQSRFDDLKARDEVLFHENHGLGPYKARYRIEGGVVRRVRKTPLRRWV